MNISPNEAEEALAAIQIMMQKTRHSIASSGTYITLIVTSIVWLVGYMCTQFLSGEIVVYIWIGLSILGSTLATVLGIRMGKRVPARRQPRRQSELGSSGCSWSFTALPRSRSPGR